MLNDEQKNKLIEEGALRLMTLGEITMAHQMKTLTNYSLEQQASIIADYWFLTRYGYDHWLFGLGRFIQYMGPRDRYITHKYEKVLTKFIQQR